MEQGDGSPLSLERKFLWRSVKENKEEGKVIEYAKRGVGFLCISSNCISTFFVIR